MVAMAYAAPADVEDRLGRTLDASESQIVGTRLADAELLIKSRIADLDDKAADPSYLDTLVMIESDMVLRLIRNPDGFTQESDGNYSYQISDQVSSGRLDVLPSEWALLGVRGGVFTIKPYLKMPWEA